MIYQIVKILGQQRELFERYSTLQSAEKKIAKSYAFKNFPVKIILLPEDIGIDFEIHLIDGTSYGRIFSESESFWHILRYKDKLIVPFRKVEFEKKFIYEIFTADPLSVVIEETIKEYGETLKNLEDVKQEDKKKCKRK